MSEGFERVMLKSGEARADYIRRRLQEGADSALILKEINTPELFSGLPGKPWPAQVVYTEKRKLQPKTTDFPEIRYTPPASDRGGADAKGTESAPAEAKVVPAAYEGILSADDIAEIEAEAQKQVTAAQRKKARDELLAKTRAELERQAREAAKRGAAKGDLVDVSIDLAPYAAYISLDGERFYHGMTYRVARPVAAVLREQVQRSWWHQDSISGQRKDFNQQRTVVGSGKTNSFTGIEGLRA